MTSIVGCRILLRARVNLALELFDLITKEVKLHALVHVKGRPATMVIAKISLHVLNLCDKVYGEKDPRRHV